MVSLLEFYGLKKQGTNKRNSLAKHNPTLVAEKQRPVIGYSHRTSVLKTGRQISESLSRSLIMSTVEGPIPSLRWRGQVTNALESPEARG